MHLMTQWWQRHVCYCCYNPEWVNKWLKCDHTMHRWRKFRGIYFIVVFYEWHTIVIHSPCNNKCSPWELAPTEISSTCVDIHATSWTSDGCRMGVDPIFTRVVSLPGILCKGGQQIPLAGLSLSRVPGGGALLIWGWYICTAHKPISWGLFRGIWAQNRQA